MNKLRKQLIKKLRELNKIISDNAIFSQSTKLIEKYNFELQEIKYKKGIFSEYQRIDNDLKKQSNELDVNLRQANEIMRNSQAITSKYRDFIYDLTLKIYDIKTEVVFDILLKENKKSQRPISFDFNITGDAAEGINEVKKNLFDYLICKYNKKIQMMLHDSSCYSGIDPRQVIGLLEQLELITNNANKQVIVSINKYQLGDSETQIQKFNDKSVVVLDENNKLLGFNF